MELEQMLQKLKFLNRFNRSSLTKDIIVNIRHINKTELLNILDLFNNATDIEYQVNLISILTAYIVFNNLYRDVIIKSIPLYETLNTILARGHPLKTAVTLNFVTSILYAEDDGGSRNKTLTMHAQNLIRNSGCLTAMTDLFMNYMLHTETWQALCRCLAEVIRGSEPNQSFCSHLVPLCVQRSLKGNPDVLPVLQSLLSNHKRNTNLFLETDGALIFNRKDYLRLEASLQLLNIVVQNGEVEAISNIAKENSLYKKLHELLKTNNANSSIAQWTTVVLYYLDLKLNDNNKCGNASTTNFKENTLCLDSNINDTRTLLQNIMSEVLSYPPEMRRRSPLKTVFKVPKKFTGLWDVSHVEERNSHRNESNILEQKAAPPPNLYMSRNERLSFSFLMNDSLKFNQTDFNTKNNNYQNCKVNHSFINPNKFTRNRESHDRSKLCHTFKSINSKCENMMDFKPTFASTPKRLKSKMLSVTKNTSFKRSFSELNNKNRIIKNVPKKTVSQEKHNTKNKSMSSRLFEAINESCTTVIRSVKNFIGNKSFSKPKQDVVDKKSVKNDHQKSHCSYSFTNYMQRREAELLESNTNKDSSSEPYTLNTANMCNTCDNTLLLQQKFSNDEQLKHIIKKLKLGINLYGCDFKRISKTMWPRETYMTPTVVYNLYRKLLLK